MAAGRTADPAAMRTEPQCPQGVSGAAAVVWRDLVKQLHTLGVVTPLDSQALARYCTLITRWWELSDTVKREGEVYEITDEDGNVKSAQQRPEVGILNKLSTLLLGLEQQFGLTPAARASLKPIDPAGAEAKERKFFGSKSEAAT